MPSEVDHAKRLLILLLVCDIMSTFHGAFQALSIAMALDWGNRPLW